MFPWQKQCQASKNVSRRMRRLESECAVEQPLGFFSNDAQKMREYRPGQLQVSDES
jgi:hypothetical protein